MKQIYSSNELWDELKELRDENETLYQMVFILCRALDGRLSQIIDAAKEPDVYGIFALKKNEMERQRKVNVDLKQVTRAHLKRFPVKRQKPFRKSKNVIRKQGQFFAPLHRFADGLGEPKPPTLRAEREAAGLSLKEVACRLRVSAGFLSQLEQGKRALFMPELEQYRRALKPQKGIPHA